MTLLPDPTEVTPLTIDTTEVAGEIAPVNTVRLVVELTGVAPIKAPRVAAVPATLPVRVAE